MKNTDFIAMIGDIARKDMVKTGVLASLTIAQAILESGWGRSDLAVTGNNLFGMKATSAWTGKTYTTETNECYDGVNMERVEAVFRAYDSWEESIADHSALFSASRYKKVVGETDYKVACVEVKNAGYATDPSYPTKLISIIEQYNLHEYDVVADDEVVQEHWAKPYENMLLSRGLITTAKTLDESPTWGELAVVTCKILGLIEVNKDD